MSNSLVLKEEISYLHGSYSFSLRILGHDVLCITHLKVPIKIVGTQQDAGACYPMNCDPSSKCRTQAENGELQERG